MDSAQKALMLAGSIIIILLILSACIMFVSRSSFFVEIFENKLIDTDIKNHNNHYAIFEGRVAGVEIINACTIVVENNKLDNTIGMTLIATFGGKQYKITPDNYTDYGNIINNVNRTRVYNGSLYRDNEGVITRITFVE